MILAWQDAECSTRAHATQTIKCGTKTQEYNHFRATSLIAHHKYCTGAPLLPCAIVRQADGRFRVTPGRPILVSRDLDRDEAVAKAAQAFADDLEARIREHPHCWYQFYPYWESQRDEG